MYIQYFAAILKRRDGETLHKYRFPWLEFCAKCHTDSAANFARAKLFNMSELQRLAATLAILFDDGSRYHYAFIFSLALLCDSIFGSSIRDIASLLYETFN
jgi:hypothetical protein